MITVIMPAKNAAPTILEAVSSVLSQREVGELVVVDDGSTDTTLSMLENINDNRLRICSSAGNGIADAINTGAECARFEYLARCDADDFYPEERFAWQLDYLQNNLDYAAVCGGFTMADEDGRIIGDLPMKHRIAGDITEGLLRGQSETHLCTWLFRKIAFEKVGGVRRWFITAEDTDLQFRLAATGKVWYEPSMYYIYRVTDTSITHSSNHTVNVFFADCARAFALQRADNGGDDLQLGKPPTVPENQGRRKTAQTHIASLNEGIAWHEYEKGNHRLAIESMLKAVKVSPGNFSLWKGLFSVVFKSFVSKAFGSTK